MLVASMSSCMHKSATTEDSVVVIENVMDTTSVDSIVPNDSIQ